MEGEREKRKGGYEQPNPPLISLAGFVGTGVAQVALAKDKLMVLESHTASHTGRGVGPPVRGTHWDEAVRTTTGQTWGREWEVTIIMKEERINSITYDEMSGRDDWDTL